MSIDSLPGFLHWLALCVSWIVLLYGVSSAYGLTIRRFDHSDWRQDRKRYLIEERSRRRL